MLQELLELKGMQLILRYSRAENSNPGFPLGLENLEKWEGIFQSGKSQGILNRLEKSGKTTQNTGKLREFQKKIICYFSMIFKWTVYYLLKWIKFPVKKNKTLKKYWKMEKKILEKSGNFVSLEKWEPCNLLKLFVVAVSNYLKFVSFLGCFRQLEARCFQNNLVFF